MTMVKMHHEGQMNKSNKTVGNKERIGVTAAKKNKFNKTVGNE